MTVIPTRFQLRRDTAANWTSVNPTLLDGEPAVETDTRKEKTGDGATAWNSLPYQGGGAVDSVAGKTGAVTLVKGDVGLGDVDNTSDADKPVSTATQTALDGKASETSGTWTPTFTSDGTPPTVTYTRQTGEWRRFGKMIHLFGEIELSSMSSPGTGYLQIGGFPTAATTGRYVGALTIGRCINFVTRRPTGGYVFNGGSVCWLVGDNGATALSELTTANLSASALLVFNILYALP